MTLSSAGRQELSHAVAEGRGVVEVAPPREEMAAQSAAVGLRGGAGARCWWWPVRGRRALL